MPPPALCISPDETKLAISYGHDHEVRIHDFSPGGQVRLNLEPSQVLKSAGAEGPSGVLRSAPKGRGREPGIEILGSRHGSTEGLRPRLANGSWIFRPARCEKRRATGNRRIQIRRMSRTGPSKSGRTARVCV